MALIPCPECKTEISELAISCPKCGFPIAAKKETKKSPTTSPPPINFDPLHERICPACKAVIENDFWTCPKCGAPIAQGAVNPSASQLGGPPQMPAIYISPSQVHGLYLPFAGFLSRVYAWFLDWLIWIAAWFILFGVLLTMWAVSAHEPVGLTLSIFSDRFLKALFDRSENTNLIWKILGYVLNCLYFAFFESSSWQGTPGKKILNLKVMDEAGDRISFGVAFLRNICKFFSDIILGIGYIMVAFTRKKQGLHDWMAGTVVCYGSGSNVGGQGNRQNDSLAPLKYDQD
jgi:uncharacterized RDD family membrane protein YckC